MTNKRDHHSLRPHSSVPGKAARLWRAQHGCSAYVRGGVAHSALATIALLAITIIASLALTAQPASADSASFNVAINGKTKINEGDTFSYGISIDAPPPTTLTVRPASSSALLRVDTPSVTWEPQSVLSTDWMQFRSVTLTAVDDDVCNRAVDTIWVTNNGMHESQHGHVLSFEILDDDCNEINPVLVASTNRISLDEGQSATYTVTMTERVTAGAVISLSLQPQGNTAPQWQHRQTNTRRAINVGSSQVGSTLTPGSSITINVTAPVLSDNANDHAMLVRHHVASTTQPEINNWIGADVLVTVQNTNPGRRDGPNNCLRCLPPAFYSADDDAGLALTAGSGAVALSPAFSTNVLSYRAEVPAGTTSVTLTPHWSGEASVHAGSRQGATTFTRPTRVRPSGTAVDLALAPDGGATELYVMVSGSDGMTTYSIHVTEARDDGTPEQQQQQIAEYEPGMVGELQVTTTPTTATVSWSAPQRGGEATGYIAHLKPADGGKGKTKRPDAPKTHTTFRNLEPGATYKVWVRAQNDAGKGLRRNTTITLPDGVERASPEE